SDELNALFRLAFAAPTPIGLSLLVRLSRWPIIQKVRRHPGRTLGSVCLYALGFRSFSLPSSGCFSPFPHGTCSLSVAEEYLGLEGGPPTFRQDCTCPALLKDHSSHYPYWAITHCGTLFQTFPVVVGSSL